VTAQEQEQPPPSPEGWISEHRELIEARAKLAEQAHVINRLADLGVNANGEPLRPDVAPEVLIHGQHELERRLARQWADKMLSLFDWQPPEVMDLADELALPRQTHIYRIPAYAGWNHNVLLAGPRKVGKSQLMVNLAASLSLACTWQDPQTGQWQWKPGRFLGLCEAYGAGNVAYLNAEMDADDWRDCFRALPHGSYDPKRIFPLHCRGVPMPVITSPAARKWFVSGLRKHSVETLIIDTWGALCEKNGVRNFNDDGEARKILSGLDEIKAEAGVASVYVLIHMPHQTGDRHLERFKGAGAVGDWADALWSYIADAEGTRYLSATGRARIDAAEMALDYGKQTGQLWWGSTGSRAQTTAERQRRDMMAALAEAGEAGLLTGELLEAAGGHTDTARKMARAMAKCGELETETKGKAIRYWLPGSKPGDATQAAGKKLDDRAGAQQLSERWSNPGPDPDPDASSDPEAQ
jgi:hypothetical protein